MNPVDYVSDHDRLVKLETVLVGYDGQNGMRGTLKAVEEKHDALALKVDERFDKLFARMWWILGALLAGAFVIAGAIISAH